MIFVQFQDPWTHTPTVLPGMASHKPDVDETNEAFDLDDGLKQVGPPPPRFFSSDVLLIFWNFKWNYVNISVLNWYLDIVCVSLELWNDMSELSSFDATK